MALTKTTITGTITLADGSVPSGILQFTPTGFDTDGQVIANEAVQVTLTDEIQLLWAATGTDVDIYRAHVAAQVSWGQTEKAKLGPR